MTIPKSFLWLLAAAGALVAPYLFWLHILFLHNLWVGLFGPDIDGGGWFAAFFFATSSIALCAASIATAISTSPGGGPRP